MSLIRSFFAKFLKYLISFAPAIFFALAIYIFHQELEELSFATLRLEIANWPAYRFEASLLLLLLNFFVLSAFDAYGLYRQQEHLPYAKVFKISFMSFSLSNLVGHSLFSGTSLRLKLYGREGIAVGKITRVGVENTIATWLGFFFLAGISLLCFPDDANLLGVSPAVVSAIGALLLCAVLAFLAFSLWKPGELRVGSRIAFHYPNFRAACGYLLISTIDLAICAGVLYALLANHLSISFFHFVALFILAQLSGLVSQVPGGLGVFEGIFLKLSAPFGDAHITLTALIVFRVIYYFIPFCITTVWIGADYLREKYQQTQQAVGVMRSLLAPLIAQSLAILTFTSGIILLVSANIPSVESRIEVLSSYIPLALLEFSHLASSIAGLLLLLLSFELWSKNRKALYIVQIILGVAIVASLLKGFDYEEASILAGILSSSWIFRGAFYKRTGEALGHFSVLQIVAVFICLSASVWLGFFAYRGVPYSNDIWFSFDFSDDSARFLRSVLVVLVSFALLLVRSYVKGTKPLDFPQLSAEDWTAIGEILKNVYDTGAQLVWLGDKHVLLSDDKKAFLMFGVQGSSWIVLGDIYGERDSSRQLMQAFSDRADRAGAKAVFYQLSEASLALALEAGFQVFKLGEEAHIELQSFSLQGQARRSLRASMNRGDSDGLQFRIVPVADVPAIMPRLREISDAWLKEKNAHEKGFSLGFFSEAYLEHFDCAVIEKDSKIIAFANLWIGARQELSLDLMRYDTHAPKGTMDYLFLKILMWGKAEGFATFNFGMSPLSGLRTTPWGPLWYKVGSFIFRHGEQFYNFQGFRDYKEKYDPLWKMRFIAAPGGLSFLKAISDVTLLIGGGALGTLGIRKAKK